MSLQRVAVADIIMVAMIVVQNKLTDPVGSLLGLLEGDRLGLCVGCEKMMKRNIRTYMCEVGLSSE